MLDARPTFLSLLFAHLVHRLTLGGCVAHEPGREHLGPEVLHRIRVVHEELAATVRGSDGWGCPGAACAQRMFAMEVEVDVTVDARIRADG